MTAGMVPVLIRVNGQPAVRGTLEMGTDLIDVTSFGASKPNMAWTFTDPAGHFHAWDKDENLPTLDRRVEVLECPMDHPHTVPDDLDDDEDLDECEGMERHYYACRICGYEVQPDRVPVLDKQYAPGRSWWTVTTQGPDLSALRGQDVSVTISSPDEEPRFFGVAHVMTTGLFIDTEETHMATLTGAGPLGRRGK